MTTSKAYGLPPISARGMRLLSGGSVLLLHVLVVITLLIHLHATTPPSAPSRSLVLLTLKPDVPPAPAPRPVTPTRSFGPPSAALSAPIFTFAPRETRGITVPEPAAPPAPGASAPAERKTPQDLFSDQKKEEFRRFFQRQAAEDQRENAKAASAARGCDVFRKPGEQNLPDLQASNGITKNFVPAFGIGIHAPDDGKAYMEACN